MAKAVAYLLARNFISDEYAISKAPLEAPFVGGNLKETEKILEAMKTSSGLFDQRGIIPTAMVIAMATITGIMEIATLEVIGGSLVL